MAATTGKIVDCWDSICDRTTISIQVNDARQFFHNATGNHQVVVYGDYLADLRELCGLLDIKLVEEKGTSPGGQDHKISQEENKCWRALTAGSRK